MTTEEVRSVLGTPEQVIEFPAGRRWVYDETGATTGWVCVVDFSTAEGTHRLKYFCNVLHILFPTTPYHEFGSPIDDGKFDTMQLLRFRREEWQKR
jgi:hypothetical protein